MPESTLSVSKTQIDAAVGVYLGFGRGTNYSETAWTTRQVNNIADCVRSGLSSFYFPAPDADAAVPYDWSFLRPVRTTLLTVGSKTAPLPDDFAGLEGDIRLLNSGQVPVSVDQTNDQVILQKYFEWPDVTGQPRLASVQAIQSGQQTKGTRQQLFVFPQADATYTLEFQYYFAPDTLIASIPYPHGGATHGETILASCIAAAELYLDGTPGPRAAYFKERLAASIGLDRRMKAQVTGYNSDPRYNRPTDWRNRHWITTNPITFDGVSPG